MDDMTRNEYWDEIRSIRENLLDEWRDERGDTKDDPQDWLYERLNQTIDGHQWIIYYSYNIDVLRFTDNRDAYYDQMGEWPTSDTGLQGMLAAIAYQSMYQDVMDGLEPEDFETTED
jgi:hypothetical protein